MYKRRKMFAHVVLLDQQASSQVFSSIGYHSAPTPPSAASWLPPWSSSVLAQNVTVDSAPSPAMLVWTTSPFETRSFSSSSAQALASTYLSETPPDSSRHHSHHASSKMWSRSGHRTLARIGTLWRGLHKQFPLCHRGPDPPAPETAMRGCSSCRRDKTCDNVPKSCQRNSFFLCVYIYISIYLNPSIVFKNSWKLQLQPQHQSFWVWGVIIVSNF